MGKKWILVTANVGDGRFYGASMRLQHQAHVSGLFTESICITNADLKYVFPEMFAWYSDDQLQGSKGYGWYAWKCGIPSYIFDKYPGEDIGIMYLDAGCELNINFITKYFLKHWMVKAERVGCVGFSIHTPENLYSKSLLLSKFYSTSNFFPSEQFQSGSWLLTGKIGRSISKDWRRIAAEDPLMTNDNLGEEVADFIAHRHDQSIFSLVLKSYKISPERMVPVGSPITRLKRLKGYFFAIWWARNLSETSLL